MLVGEQSINIYHALLAKSDAQYRSLRMTVTFTCDVRMLSVNYLTRPDWPGGILPR